MYSITVWSATPKTTLWRGPGQRFEPGTSVLYAGEITRCLSSIATQWSKCSTDNMNLWVWYNWSVFQRWSPWAYDPMIHVSTIVHLCLWSNDPCFYDGPPEPMIQLIHVSAVVHLSLWSNWSMFIRWSTCAYDPMIQLIHVSAMVHLSLWSNWSMFLRWSTWAYDPTDPTDPCFCDGPPVPMIQLIHVSTMVHLCLWSNWSMFLW